MVREKIRTDNRGATDGKQPINDPMPTVLSIISVNFLILTMIESASLDGRVAGLP